MGLEVSEKEIIVSHANVKRAFTYKGKRTRPPIIAAQARFSLAWVVELSRDLRFEVVECDHQIMGSSALCEEVAPVSPKRTANLVTALVCEPGLSLWLPPLGVSYSSPQ